jgi:hypothetical protein
LRMRSIIQRVAKQSFGSIGVAQCGQQEINGGTCRIDGPVQVALAAFYPKVGFIHPPRLVGWLQVPAQSLL